MPIDDPHWAFAQCDGLTDHQHMVLVYSARRANKEHIAFPSVGTIAKAVGHNTRTVQRCLHGLHGQGPHIRCQTRGGRRLGSTLDQLEGQPTHYRLAVPEPAGPDNGGSGRPDDEALYGDSQGVTVSGAVKGDKSARIPRQTGAFTVTNEALYGDTQVSPEGRRNEEKQGGRGREGAPAAPLTEGRASAPESEEQGPAVALVRPGPGRRAAALAHPGSSRGMGDEP